MRNAIIAGIIGGWIAGDESRGREVELLSLVLFGPLLLHAQMNEERPRPLWATQVLAAGGAAAVTYKVRQLTRGDR